jgi:hypothetical protein
MHTPDPGSGVVATTLGDCVRVVERGTGARLPAPSDGKTILVPNRSRKTPDWHASHVGPAAACHCLLPPWHDALRHYAAGTSLGTAIRLCVT